MWNVHETGALLEQPFDFLVVLTFEGAVLQIMTLDFDLVGVIGLSEKIRKRNRQRSENNFLIFAVGGNSMEVLAGSSLHRLLFGNNVGQRNGIGGGLFLFFGGSCAAIFSLIFFLVACRLDGRLGGDGIAGLLGFHHGRRRVEGC